MPQDPFEKYRIQPVQPTADPFERYRVPTITPTAEPEVPWYRKSISDIINNAYHGAENWWDRTYDLGKQAWEWGSQTDLTNPSTYGFGPDVSLAGLGTSIAGAPYFREFKRGTELLSSVRPESQTLRKLAEFEPGPAAANIAKSTVTPINLGMALASGGESIAARAGAEGLANLLYYGQKAASVPFALEGAQQISEGDNLMEKGFGALELAGGIMGLGAPKTPIPRLSTERIASDIRTKPHYTAEQVAAALREKQSAPAGEAIINPATGRPMKQATNAPGPLREIDTPWPEVPSDTMAGTELVNRLKQIDKEATDISIGRAEAKAELPTIERPKKYRFENNQFIEETPEPELSSGEKALGVFYPPTEEPIKKIEQPLPNPVLLSTVKEAELPPGLKGSKPRYNWGDKSYELDFQSDMDKSLLIIAQDKKSKADKAFLQFVMNNTGLTEAKARQLGKKVKAEIKAVVAGKEPGKIKVPSMFQKLIKSEEGGLPVEPLSLGQRFIKEEEGGMPGPPPDEPPQPPKPITAPPKKPFYSASDVKTYQQNQQSLGKLMNAISGAKKVAGEQATLMAIEKSQRVRKASQIPVKDMSSFRQRMARLSGEYTKADFEPLKLDQPDVDNLVKGIHDNQTLTFFEKIRATTGLSKLVGEHGGKVPQPSELRLLEKAYGPGFVKSLGDAGFIIDPISYLYAKHGPFSLTRELVNFPRAVMASWDMSAPLRQGIGLIHRKEFWTSLDDMMRAWGSEDFYKGTMAAIESDPRYHFATEMGVRMTDLGEVATREEQFFSKAAELYPLVKRSERAYTAFLNKLRFDTFNSLIKDADRAGLDVANNLMLGEEIANYVNNATGRGSIKGLESAMTQMNSLLFSPRLIASRVNMLNPATYIQASPFVRKQYLKSMLGIAGLGATVTGLGTMAGGEVETNPSSADFGKLRVGNTRLDPWGGFQQYLVTAHRLISGDMKSTTTGREYELGSRYGTPTKLDVAGRFVLSKLNPTASFVTTMLQQKNFAGAPLQIQREIASRIFPIIVQDLKELSQEDNKLMMGFALPAFFGMGIQTYPEYTSGSQLMQGDINR